MSTLVIVNPNATTAQPSVLGVVVEAFATLGEIRVRTTESHSQATAIAAAALSDGTEVVVAVGGDGTVNGIVNGLMSRGPGPGVPALAVVPAGNANVFARNLGFPNDPIEATAMLIEGIREQRLESINLGRADDRYFLFNAGLGLDAEVLTRVERQRARGLKASLPLYVASGVLAHATRTPFAEPPMTISFDDREPITGVFTTIVQNAPVWTYFGSIPVTFAPDAGLHDGLAVYGIRSLDTLSVSNHLALAALRPSRLAADSGAVDVSHFTVRAVVPTPLQLDGDVVGERQEVQFNCVRDALRVVAPRAITGELRAIAPGLSSDTVT